MQTFTRSPRLGLVRPVGRLAVGYAIEPALLAGSMANPPYESTRAGVLVQQASMSFACGSATIDTGGCGTAAGAGNSGGLGMARYLKRGIDASAIKAADAKVRS